MTRWLQVAIVASLLFAGYGTAPTAPTPAATPAPPPSAVVPTLIVTVSTMPFHVDTPGDVHYEVTGVNALASLEYTSTDGSIEFGGTMGPAPPTGTVRMTYARAGTFTATLTATTALGTALHANVAVTVVE
jgi:hypothetical protein